MDMLEFVFALNRRLILGDVLGSMFNLADIRYLYDAKSIGMSHGFIFDLEWMYLA